MDNKIKVGVSSCLLGNDVRFNGSNSHKKLVSKELGEIFSYHPVCPEIAAGFGVPREPIYLQSSIDKIKVITSNTKIDVTEKLEGGCQKVLNILPSLSGFILKKSSPSCGQESVKLYSDKKDIIHAKADGRFVEALKKKYPLMPIEDEGRLNDPYLKEHFIKRVFLTDEASSQSSSAKDFKDLQVFHARHKMMLRLHHPLNQKTLGCLISDNTRNDFDVVKKEYLEIFLQSFRKIATRGNHHTILQRLLREINKMISDKERSDLQTKLKRFYDGVLPLAVPFEIIQHYLTRYKIDYLERQSYLNLYPHSLGLMSRM
ncbi:MAG: hypothetical protein ACJA0H_001031 [Francisellaceae bacterium]|jgi:uncharacterized protein YbbK (DUF523 family)/uncharacterized protein YbgA (DUF1722 family)